MLAHADASFDRGTDELMGTEGFSAAGLGRMHEAMAAHVAGGSMPGLVSLVARHDDVDVQAIGTKAFGDADPIGRDANRIASLTKPVAAAAAMMLVDDGTVRLDDPVDDLLPELANRRVLTSIDARLEDTVRAKRSITLDDLVTLRLGVGSVMAPPDTYPIQTAERELELGTLGPPIPPSPLASDEWIRRLGTLPLMAQPGEQWLYSTGLQVLGVFIERASGESAGSVSS
jgi:CubicO group peptidase (beta-lactamase class C family)